MPTIPVYRLRVFFSNAAVVCLFSEWTQWRRVLGIRYHTTSSRLADDIKKILLSITVDFYSLVHITLNVMKSSEWIIMDEIKELTNLTRT